MDNTNNQTTPDENKVTTPEANPDTKDVKDVKETPATPEVDLNEDPALDGFTDGSDDKDDKKDSKDGDDYDPYNVDNVKKIAKEQINQAVAPFQEQLYQARIESEVNKIMGDNPEYKPYEERVRKWVTHPNRQKLIRQGLPVRAVVYEALAPYLEKIGAEKARKSDAEAKESGTPANSVKVTEKSGNPYAGMTPAQIEAIANRVKAGQYQE